MAKASREFVYGLNPAFEVLRAGKRRVFAAHLNEGMRENSRVKSKSVKIHACRNRLQACKHTVLNRVVTRRIPTLLIHLAY